MSQCEAQGDWAALQNSGNDRDRLVDTTCALIWQTGQETGLVESELQTKTAPAWLTDALKS
jgi:hypothetical protein